MDWIITVTYNYGSADDITFYKFKGNEDDVCTAMWKLLNLSDDADAYEMWTADEDIGWSYQLMPESPDICGKIITAKRTDNMLTLAKGE